MITRFLATFFAVAAAASLGGCASTSFIDAQVQSFARAATAAEATPLPAQARFSFERLPSQEVGAQTATATAEFKLQASAQQALENAVAARLTQFGWQRADASNAQFSVQVSARATRLNVAWDNQWPWPHQYWDGLARQPVLLRSGSWAWVSPLGTSFPARSALEPNTANDVTVLVRNKASGEVVFEASAKSASRTRSNGAAALEEFSALAVAAMADFPSANPQPRLKRQAVQPEVQP